MSLFHTLTLTVVPPPQTYEILVGEDLLLQADFINCCKSLEKKMAVIVIAPLEKQIGRPLQRALGEDVECIVVPAGEELKSRNWKEKIEDHLQSKGYGKESCLIGIGGGTLLDLVGFIAATFCRGIPYISIPTTLLSMTDGAIGGKTAINLGHVKNFLGAFHPPFRVWIDITFLKTLSETEFWSGFSETVKHALIGSKELFYFLNTHFSDIQERPYLLECIAKSCAVKKKIVEEDPFETNGRRTLLNFGHTIGHALESLSQYTLSHGMAVRVGMQVEAWMAKERGDLSLDAYAKILTFLNRLPSISLSLSSFSLSEWLSFILLDKKTRQGIPHFVSLTSIGSAHVVPLDTELLSQGVKHAMRCD